VAVHRKDGYPYDYHQGALKFLVRSDVNYAGVLVPRHTWQVIPESVQRQATS